MRGLQNFSSNLPGIIAVPKLKLLASVVKEFILFYQPHSWDGSSMLNVTCSALIAFNFALFLGQNSHTRRNKLRIPESTPPELPSVHLPKQVCYSERSMLLSSPWTPMLRIRGFTQKERPYNSEFQSSFQRETQGYKYSHKKMKVCGKANKKKLGLH